MEKKKILMLGGDKRQYYMAKFLTYENFAISYFGNLFETDWENIKKIRTLENLEEGMKKNQFDYVVLPIPMNQEYIKGTENEVSMYWLLQKLKIQKTTTVLGGQFPAFFMKELEKEGIKVVDFMLEESIALLNAELTAEGAAVEAILLSDSGVINANALVIGYGRCGRMLADLLKGMKARVTVAEIAEDRAALAVSYGYRVEALEDLSKYQFIFQTVPKESVLSKQLLSSCLLGDRGKEVVILDISSEENSIDLEYAGKHAILVKRCPGVPGKYTPKSAGELLGKFILKLEKEG